MVQKIFFSLLGAFSLFHTKVFAWDAGVLSGLPAGKTSVQERIRTWDIHAEDIPVIIVGAINYIMWFAATLSIIFIIIGAYKILFWSTTWETSDGKKTIFLALGWFALAALSWLILKLILDNFL